MSEHTPGENWKLNERDLTVKIKLSPYHYVTAYGGTLGNARLMAQAPNLLEACKLTAAIVIDKYDAGDEALNAAWDAAREVIAAVEAEEDE